MRTLTFMDVCENIAGAVWIGAITLAFVTHDLKQGEEWWGFINAAYYTGAIIGGLLAAWMSQFIQNSFSSIWQLVHSFMQCCPLSIH